jgi:hypothetical protein
MRAGFLTGAAKRGASIFKMMDQSRHRSVETLRGYVRERSRRIALIVSPRLIPFIILPVTVRERFLIFDSPFTPVVGPPARSSYRLHVPRPQEAKTRSVSKAASHTRNPTALG